MKKFTVVIRHTYEYDIKAKDSADATEIALNASDEGIIASRISPAYAVDTRRIADDSETENER